MQKLIRISVNQEKMLNKYRRRIADRLLKRKLAGKGAVLLEGAKWCGKTTTAVVAVVAVLRTRPVVVAVEKRCYLFCLYKKHASCR